MPDSVRARCRLIPDFWKLAVVCLAMFALTAGAGIAQPPHDFEGWSAGAAMLVLWGATPFYWLVALGRGCIVFDENGARWRAAFGVWKSARWDEIESCDARLNSDGGKIAHWKFVVHTRRGAFSWTNSFEQADQLAPFAARFCSLIPADAEAWPRRFDYGGGENLVVPGACLSLFVVFAGALAKGLIEANWNTLAAQFAVYIELYGWLLTVAGFAVFGVLIVGLPLLFLLFFFDIALQGWRRRNESFLATTRGLSWRIKENERFFAAWDELQILHIEARGRPVSLPFFRLQSARGDFTWNNNLCGSLQLSRTCFERAPQLQRAVQARLSEELNQTRDETGELLTFDFQTRSGRAMLYFIGTVSAVSYIPLVYGPLEPPKNGEPIPIWVFAILAVAGTAATSYGTQLFRRGRIVLDARGIRWDLPLRKGFVAWDEIGGLLADKRLFLQIGARRVPLSVYGIYPARAKLLMETIARRAVNAGGTWKAADETRAARRVE